MSHFEVRIRATGLYLVNSTQEENRLIP